MSRPLLGRETKGNDPTSEGNFEEPLFQQVDTNARSEGGSGSLVDLAHVAQPDAALPRVAIEPIKPPPSICKIH